MPNLIVTLTWKVVSVLKNNPPIHQDNILFNIVPKKGLYSQFTAPLNQCYVPLSFLPTNVFHENIKNLVREKCSVDIEEKKFPYKIFIPSFNKEVSVNINIRLFQPNILSLTVELSSFSLPLNVDQLRRLQKLDQIEVISDIIRWIIGMAETINHKKFTQSPSFRFRHVTHLAGVCPLEQFQSHIKENLSNYVGILISDFDYKAKDNELPQRILDENTEYNIKYPRELLLVNKQGVLYITPSNTEGLKSRENRRFFKVRDLYEIAFVFSTYLARVYPLIRLQNEDFADFLLYKIQPWINESESLLAEGRSDQYIWDALLRAFALKARLPNPKVLFSIESKTECFDQFAIDWWVDRDFPDLIAEKIDESRDIKFGFLKDKDLKQVIIEDYREAKRCFKSKCYKATVIFCGAIVEAILTDAIQRGGYKKKIFEDCGLKADKHGNLNYDDKILLNRLICAAEKAHLITDESLLNHLRSLKDYRNGIHPTVQIRRSLPLGEEIAKTAFAAIDRLVKHLNVIYSQGAF